MLDAFAVQAGCSQSDGFNLCLVNLRICDGQAASAVAKHRVVLVKGGNLFGQLVAVNVKLLGKSLELGV